MGTVAKVDGKNVWSLDCNWCILNAPVASAVKASAENPASAATIQPLVGALDPVTQPIPVALVAPVVPAVVAAVAASDPLQAALVAMGKLILAEVDRKLSAIPAPLSTTQLGIDLIANQSFTLSIAERYGLVETAPVVAAVRTPNPVAAGTTLCPAVIKSGVRLGEACEELVKNPANSHCGRHHQLNVSTAPAVVAAPAVVVDPAELAANAFAELQTLPV